MGSPDAGTLRALWAPKATLLCLGVPEKPREPRPFPFSTRWSGSARGPNALGACECGGWGAPR